MADIEMKVIVRGSDAGDVMPIITNTTRVLADWLEDAGHSLVTAKVAVECPGCGKLVTPGPGALCNTCAQMEAGDRGEEAEGFFPIPGLLPMPAEPADVLF